MVADELEPRMQTHTRSTRENSLLLKSTYKNHKVHKENTVLQMVMVNGLYL